MRKIENPIFNKDIQDLSNKVSCYRIKDNDKESEFQLYHKYGIDIDQCTKTFPSINIQGLYAVIVH